MHLFLWHLITNPYYFVISYIILVIRLVLLYYFLNFLIYFYILEEFQLIDLSVSQMYYSSILYYLLISLMYLFN